MNKDKTEIELLDQLPTIPSITEKQLAKIKKRIGEYKRAKTIFGHSTSQTAYTLLTLNMISDSPMARMKQCMAQIDRKFLAVEEAYFDIEKKKIEIEGLLEKEQTKMTRLQIIELESKIMTITTNMGNALRQVGMFQNMYDAIKKAHKIPDDWDESDFEKQEYENMVRK